MSRPSAAGQRHVNSNPNVAAQGKLSLTEELEKVEQSITLTLQEIDHNFSRAHRIVTTSILPIVEQYAEHSQNVWEGSKFWKQFFEASANVSLSGYEEPPAEDENTTQGDSTTTATPSTSTDASPHSEATLTPRNHSYPENDIFTPSATYQPQPPKQRQPTTAPYSSPYEALKRETLEVSPPESTLPSTPRAAASPAPQSSPFAPPSTAQHKAQRTPANDVLLHRVLDKNWRLQATPHSTARPLPHRSKSAHEITPRPSTAKRGRNRKSSFDLDSSPAVPAPELHAEIFDTPARKNRTPGVSVLTPAKGGKPGNMESVKKGTIAREQIWDSDSDEEAGEGMGGLGMSPPKTMQFHIPQARLLQTPAREASKRIIEDLLLTAGGSVTDDLDEDSPSVVRRMGIGDEDTF